MGLQPRDGILSPKTGSLALGTGGLGTNYSCLADVLRGPVMADDHRQCDIGSDGSPQTSELSLQLAGGNLLLNVMSHNYFKISIKL